MDPNVHESEIMEPGELLEDYWFFGNNNRKSRMLRSFSDPCTSSNYSHQEMLPGKSYEETYESIKKELQGQDHGEFMPQPNPRRSRSNRKNSSDSLVRAPSLPTSLEMIEEFQDDEIEFSMGKLIRQASMNYSDNLPPRDHAANKALRPSSSMSRSRSRRKPELESIKFERPMNQLETNDLESEEILQGFKDLGLDLDQKGLQEKTRIIKDEEKSTHSSAPPVPKWGGGKRSTEDMKAQIKFWARAVASNVRQEC